VEPSSGAVGGGLRHLGGNGVGGLRGRRSRIHLTVDESPDEPAGNGDDCDEHENACPAKAEERIFVLPVAGFADVFSKFDPVDVVIFHLTAFTIGFHETADPDFFIDPDGAGVAANYAFIEYPAGQEVEMFLFE